MSKKENEKISTIGLRDKLKAFMLKELDKLPEHLEKLEPKERMNIIIKIMPFIFPKVDTVSSTDGEPFSIEW